MKKVLVSCIVLLRAKRLNQLVFTLAFVGALVSSCSQKVETREKLVAGDIPVCGTVQFSEGCGESIDSLISYGIALVHHMTYPEAETVFDRVIDNSPECFWGHWGKALTYIHPVWPDVNSEEQLRLGMQLSDKALSLASTGKEKAYAGTIAAYYEGDLTKTKAERLKSYEKLWEKAYESFPEDLEAKSFYALSLISIADPADKTYEKQRKAGALAEEVLTIIPDHPGGFHYTIHAYDNPVLSDKALMVANNYGKIAPQVPHALHMPSHIYIRLGMWKESIDWNTRSAKAALEMPVQGNVSTNYFHALDYIVYSHLQRGEDEAALKVLEDYKKVSPPYQNHFISAYALAAMESRMLVERQDWQGAANLEIIKHNGLNWDQYPESQAITYFAKGLGGARSGSPEIAEMAISKLDTLLLATSNPYWKGQIEIQKNTVKAWLAYATGDEEGALELMQKAAELESATEKHPVTPGELLPAVELFGDMLVLLDKPAEALSQYEKALKRSPGRLNSLYGAAYAAEKKGEVEKAKGYYQLLVDGSSELGRALKQREAALRYLGSI